VLEVYGGGEKKRDGHRFNDIGPKEAPVPRFGCSILLKDLYLMTTAAELLARVKTGFPDDESEERWEETMALRRAAYSE